MAAYAFQTRSDKIIGICRAGLGRDGDGCLATCAGPAARCCALKSGTFSGRLGEMARGVGADVTQLELPPGQPVRADARARGASPSAATMS